MMGMLEGLRAGGADARSAQEMAMRQEADRRAAELHAANLDQMGLQRQQLGLQLNRARAIEDAQNTDRDLPQLLNALTRPRPDKPILVLVSC